MPMKNHSLAHGWSPVTKDRAGSVLMALVALVLMGGCATGSPRESLTSGFGLHSRPASFRHGSGPRQSAATPVLVEAEGSAGGFPEREGEAAPETPPTCGGVATLPGWPDLSSDEGEAPLAPFLACTPAQFVALQDGVDMPRLVEKLDDWRAVRLGALGPVREDAAGVLNRKRAFFLVTATEEYGAARAEVFALFVLHSSFDDDVREVLRLLARDKRLGETLGHMTAVREELERRGLRLSDYPERPERLGDVARGLARAADEALSTSELRQGALAMTYYARKEQLPPPYQRALDEVERAQWEQHLAPGHVVLGSFDELTFGVPLGFYNLAAGTGHGVYSLSQGQYEQATRELAPAALLVSLYAGGKGLRYLSETRGAPGTALGGVWRLELPEQRLRALKEMAWQLEARLGVEGLRELARELQASREAGRFVAAGGADAAVALREARGDVAKAQAWLSQARPEAVGSTPARASLGKSLGGMASLVDEAAGLTPEVVEAKLVQLELDSSGPRLPKNMAVLEKQRPALDAPAPGAHNPRWSEYVAYYEKRVTELEQGKAAKGPLRWEAYERLRGSFARGLAFERVMMELLRADAALPRALRRFLADFDNPRVEMYVGVWKPKVGLRFADVLVIEQQPPPGRTPRVETFSFKSRDFSLLDKDALTAQVIADASEALGYYGETLDIRRPSLKPLLREGGKAPVQKVRLIYEVGELEPKKVDDLKAAVKEAQKEVPGVEVLFQ